jgi:transposase
MSSLAIRYDRFTSTPAVCRARKTLRWCTLGQTHYPVLGDKGPRESMISVERRAGARRPSMPIALRGRFAASVRSIRAINERASIRPALCAWRQVLTTATRQADRADISALSRTPSARTIARLMTIGRDGLSKSETVVVAAIEAGVPLLVGAREVIAEFQAMIRRRSLADLDPWLARANLGLIAPFANGIIKDKAAVGAAISSSWSNGQTEGQITKLKLVKRQMYGRGKLDLLQARLLGAA